MTKYFVFSDTATKDAVMANFESVGNDHYRIGGGWGPLFRIDIVDGEIVTPSVQWYLNQYDMTEVPAELAAYEAPEPLTPYSVVA